MKPSYSTLTAALKEFFGYRAGEGLKEFQSELKELSDQDKEFFRQEFAKMGVEITG